MTSQGFGEAWGVPTVRPTSFLPPEDPRLGLFRKALSALFKVGIGPSSRVRAGTVVCIWVSQRLILCFVTQNKWFGGFVLFYLWKYTIETQT